MREIFVGMAGASAEACRSAIANAVLTADRPKGLHFGICPKDQAEPAPFFQAAGSASCRVLPGADLSFSQRIEAMQSLYSGQDYALQISPNVTFTKGWDRELCALLSLCPWEKPLLSCRLHADGFPRAIAVDDFLSNGLPHFTDGTKIMFALCPPRGAFIAPEMVFGPGEWMRLSREQEWDCTRTLPFSQHVFKAGFRAGVLSKPLFWPRIEGQSWPVDESHQEMDPSILPEFAEYTGLNVPKRLVSAAAYTGIFSADLSYPVQITLADALNDYLWGRKAIQGKPYIMLATALGKLPPAPKVPMEAYLSWFNNLAQLRHFPLSCYCSPDWAPRLQKILPNTHSQPEGEGSNRKKSAQPVYGEYDAFQLSKPFFIARAARQFPSHTHYGWIDMGYLHHPLYPLTNFVWDTLADDHIHLAEVDGLPDTSLFIIPKEKVSWLMDMTSVLQATPEDGPGDTGLFRWLIAAYPDQFTLHPMEQKEALLFTCMPPYAGGNPHDDA